MENTNYEVLNRAFTQAAGFQEEREKIASAASNYIRDHLLEESFARKIIPIQNVTPSDSNIQVSEHHDTLVYVVEIEPGSRAMVVNFRGAPEARLIRAPRMFIPFYSIHSLRYNKPEEELWAYKMPITKIIEERTVKDLQTIEDREFLNYVESCIQLMQTEANGGAPVAFNRANVIASAVVGSSVVKGDLALTPGAGGEDFTVRFLQRNDLVKLEQLFLNGRQLRGELILMTDFDHASMNSWTIEVMGSDKTGETMVDGYKANRIHGFKFIRTIKAGILRTGNIYMFTNPDFFGKYLLMNNVKFWIDKEVNIIKWEAWETIGMGFPNIAAVVKLELYRGSVTPTVEDVGFAEKIPVPEDEVEIKNNRVDDGDVVPVVHMY